MDELIKEINNLYGLEVHSPQRVMGGFLSENHILIQGDAKYFLKQYAFNDEDKVKGVHAVKKYFKEGGIPVILPIVNKSGNTFFSFAGEYFALFPFIDGKYIPKSELSDTAIVSLAEMLGKMHLLGKKSSLILVEQFKGWDKQKLIQKGENIITEIKKRAELLDFDKLALEDVEWRISKIKSNSTTFEELGFKNDHLIHGDYQEANVFFDNSDQVTHIFDFEKAMYAPRLYELWRSTFFMFFSGNLSSKSITQAKLFLSSYLNVYPASTQELRRGFKLFYLRSLHSFWVPAEHYLKGNSRIDKLLSPRFQTIQYIEENFEELEGKLIEYKYEEQKYRIENL